MLLLFGVFGCGEKEIDFSADVKPILNKHCISCHGGVKRNGGFSLLFRTEALDTTESGKPAILPGDAEHSEMIRRLSATDPEERMPYKEEPLSPDQIEILERWIDEGAKWGDHWAYVPPKAIKVPTADVQVAGINGDGKWVKNEIDNFVLHRLTEGAASSIATTSMPVAGTAAFQLDPIRSSALASSSPT
jgi:hypothetical protein